MTSLEFKRALDTAYELYKEGKSTREIAKLYGTSSAYVSMMFRAAGYPMRPVGRQPNKKT